MPKCVFEIPECEGCPIRRLFPNNIFVPPKRGTGTRLQIGEMPGRDETVLGEPFVGGAGLWLNSMNARAGIRRVDISLINIVNCRPQGEEAYENIFITDSGARSWIDKRDAEEAVQHCLEYHVKPFLQGRNSINDWQRIDLLGEKSLRYIGCKCEGIFKWRGSPIVVPSLNDKIIAIPTLHPAYVMKDQIYSRVVVEDLRKSLQIPPERYNLTPTLDEVQAFTAKEFAFDIETSWGGDEIFLVGLAAKPFESMVIPFQGAYIFELRRIFASAKSIIGHNSIQFDIPILRKNGIHVSEDVVEWDTMLLQHLLFPDLPHDLEFVASQFTGKPAWKHLAGDNLELYCARDTDVTLQIFLQLSPKLRRQGLEELYHLVQVPLAKTCKLMQDTGFAIDSNQVKRVRAKLFEEMKDLETKLPNQLRSHIKVINHRIKAPNGYISPKSGKKCLFMTVPTEEQVVPWRSAVEIGKYLYEYLKLPRQLHAKTNKITTDKTALEKLHRRLLNETLKVDDSGAVFAIAAIKKLRRCDELITTFCKEEMNKIGRMHTHFNVHGTSSGRLSSSEPNLQNIPESSRFIYIPSHPDWVIVETDYSQIENRLTAWFAEDVERLIRLAQSGFNEHKWFTSQIFGIPYDKVEKSSETEAPYRKAKCINHGCNYGEGALKICKTYDLEYKEVKSFWDAWHKVYFRATDEWQKKTAARAKKEGFLSTPFGRKRWFYTSSYFTESLSFLPQSTAADIIFRSMLGLMYERINWPLEKTLRIVPIAKPLPEPARMLLQVHDSLLFECPLTMVDYISNIVKTVMEQPWKELGGFSIPVEIKVGPSWGETEKWN